MSSSTGNPPPNDKPREPKPRRGSIRGKPKDEARAERDPKETSKRFEDFFGKA